MRPTILLAAALSAATLAPAAASGQQASLPTIDAASIGRQATRYFYRGRVDSLWAMVSPSWQKELGSPDWFLHQARELRLAAGEEERLVRDEVQVREGQPQYWRTAKFSTYPAEPVVLRWIIMPDGRIGGLGVNPASRNPATDAEILAMGN
jgi:hypothetical protein